MKLEMISTKQLREEFPLIRRELSRGVTFLLIHRSQPIAKITPVSEVSIKPSTNIRKLAGGARFQEKLGRPLTPEFINELAQSRYDKVIP